MKQAREVKAEKNLLLELRDELQAHNVVEGQILLVFFLYSYHLFSGSVNDSWPRTLTGIVATVDKKGERKSQCKILADYSGCFILAVEPENVCIISGEKAVAVLHRRPPGVGIFLFAFSPLYLPLRSLSLLLLQSASLHGSGGRASDSDAAECYYIDLCPCFFITSYQRR